jgi:DNA-binding response OmpR family regulator
MSMRGHRLLSGYVSTPPIRVAVLEDDEALREEILLPALSDYGFSTQGAASAAELYRHMLSQQFDMVVLDIGLPDEDGLTVAQHLRTMSDIGIVMLTGSTDRQHQIQALHNGADGYLIKPVDLDVLAAALHSLARRMTPLPHGMFPDQASVSRWRLEADGWRLVSPRGTIVALTAIEQCVLTTLMSASNEPVLRDSLIQALNHSRYDCDPHRLEMIIHRLRRKVLSQTKEMLPLLTVRSKGYMLPGDAWHKPTTIVG